MSHTLEVRSLADSKLAFTNAVFLNPKDYEAIVGDDPAPCLKVQNAVFNPRFREGVEPSTIQLSGLQRAVAKVDERASVPVEVFRRDSAPPVSSITFEVSSLQRAVRSKITVDVEKLAVQVRQQFLGHYVRWQQQLAINSSEGAFRLTVTDFSPIDVTAPSAAKAGGGAGAGAGGSVPSPFASLEKHTEVSFTKPRDTPMLELKGAARRAPRILDKGFTFSKMGIGGLDAEFSAIFRRAFASRLYPDLMREFGMNHVRGMLLYGAPGCGKTLIARKIGAALHAKEPKKVNGPEILNKFVGQSEENIRELFLDAEKDQKENGDDSELHIIIFDEIDAICKQRGSSRDGTGVHDSIVNQLLSKIDGVDSLNNILLIGMTNRKDMIDEALLRPGRLEIHIEIGLPDEVGRVQILGIHTAKIKKAGRLAPDVDIAELAAITKNYTGAELEGLVRDALSFALERAQDSSDPTKAVDSKSIVLTMEDFFRAVNETTPAFGMRESELRGCYSNGIIPHGAEFEDLVSNLNSFVRQVQSSTTHNSLAVLLEGAPGSGKSAISAKIAADSGFPYVKRLSPDALVGMGEHSKAQAIHKVFEDAHKSPLSVIILDDIERLIDYVPLGQRFSNIVLQNLLVLVKRPPPVPERRLLVIGTTSNPSILEAMGLLDSFQVTCRVPTLVTESQIGAVLRSTHDVEMKSVEAMAALVKQPLPIKKLLLVLEMARQSGELVTPASFSEACLMCGVSVETGLAGIDVALES